MNDTTGNGGGTTLDLTSLRLTIAQAIGAVGLIVAGAAGLAVSTYQTVEGRREAAETRADVAMIRHELKGVATREDLSKLDERLRVLERADK